MYWWLISLKMKKINEEKGEGEKDKAKERGLVNVYGNKWDGIE